MTKRGLLFVSKTHLYFHTLNSKQEDLVLGLREIFSIKKAKFSFLDTAIEVLIKKQEEERAATDKKKDKEPSLKDAFTIYRFINVENRNVCFGLITNLHQDVQVRFDYCFLLYSDIIP